MDEISCRLKICINLRHRNVVRILFAALALAVNKVVLVLGSVGSFVAHTGEKIADIGKLEVSKAGDLVTSYHHGEGKDENKK